MAFGSLIKEKRKKLKITQQQLGMQLGYKEDSAGALIRQYEAEKKTPGHKNLKQIITILDIPANEVIECLTKDYQDKLTKQLKGE